MLRERGECAGESLYRAAETLEQTEWFGEGGRGRGVLMSAAGWVAAGCLGTDFEPDDKRRDSRCEREGPKSMSSPWPSIEVEPTPSTTSTLDLTRVTPRPVTSRALKHALQRTSLETDTTVHTSWRLVLAELARSYSLNFYHSCRMFQTCFHTPV